MKLRFQKRVTLFNTVSVGIIIAFAFAGIYIVTYTADYKHLDNDLEKERLRLFSFLDSRNDSILTSRLGSGVADLQSEANPLLIQIRGRTGSVIYGPANIPQVNQIQYGKKKTTVFSDITIGKRRLRQGMFPITNSHGIKIGDAIIGISREESMMMLNSLLLVLCVSYPLIIVALYLFLLLSVRKAIAPIRNLIKAASAINDTNISTRLPLPEQEDDIYQLATTINELLERIEKSMKNQKQFTADASHEMRTPLSAIRGILEVLVRRKREPEHYERGIKDAIAQADKMHLLLEELLQLARLTAGNIAVNFSRINVYQLTIALQDKWRDKLLEKNITMLIDIPAAREIRSDGAFLIIILENLLSNAIKYGKENGTVCIAWNENENSLSVTDDGTGVPPEHLPHLFERFYRTDNSRNSKVPGYGLGLALVDKIAHLLDIRVSVLSTEGVGTCFSLNFRASSY